METAMDALFWLTVVSGALAVIFSMLPSFVPVWSRGEDGKGAPTRGGQVLIGIAVISWLCSIAVSRVQDHKADKAQAEAETKAAAETDSVTRRIAGVLTEVLQIRDESEILRQLQHQALARSDSAAATAAGIVAQQHQALAELGLSLSLSRGISDTLQAGVVLSRQIADSLRAVESSAAERSRELLALVERSRNPLSSVRANLHIHIPRTPNTADLVDRLREGRRSYRLPIPFGRRTSAYRFAPVEVSGRWVVVRDGRPDPVLLPSGLTLDFWRGDPECTRFEEHLFTAQRMLNYDSLDAIFLPSGIGLNWRPTELRVHTEKNLTVDDLHGACVSAGFYGDPINADNPVWRSVEIPGLTFAFPQGRAASVKFGPPRSGGRDSPMVWRGRVELDN
jgi:hypothetical protein